MLNGYHRYIEGPVMRSNIFIIKYLDLIWNTVSSLSTTFYVHFYVLKPGVVILGMLLVDPFLLVLLNQLSPCPVFQFTEDTLEMPILYHNFNFGITLVETCFRFCSLILPSP